MTSKDKDSKQAILSMREKLDFENFEKKIIGLLNEQRHIVVATSAKDRVTARTVSFANDGSALIKTVTSNNGVIEEDWYEEDRTFTAFDNERLETHDGIRSRYWKFKISNKDGSQLDLDTFQLYPIVLRRRMK